MNKSHLRSLSEIYNLCNLRFKANSNSNLKCINSILYSFNPIDYYNFVKNNNNSYNRHTVFNNNLLELVIITWLPGQSSGFHKHYNQCVFKVLENNICEKFLCGTKRTLYTGEIGYIDNKLEEHNMINLSIWSKTVTLHVYTI